MSGDTIGLTLEGWYVAFVVVEMTFGNPDHGTVFHWTEPRQGDIRDGKVQQIIGMSAAGPGVRLVDRPDLSSMLTVSEVQDAEVFRLTVPDPAPIGYQSAEFRRGDGFGNIRICLNQISHGALAPARLVIIPWGVDL